MAEIKEPKSWFTRHAESEAKKDRIPMTERRGAIAALVGGIIVIVFFVAHQTMSTGFFTSKFGTLEATLFYVSLTLFLLTTAARIVIGRKNVVRPFDVLLLVMVAITTVWLYVVFPFDFARLADVLPESLRFLLQWITDDIGKAVMILQILGSSTFAVYTGLLYVFVRRELTSSIEPGVSSKN